MSLAPGNVGLLRFFRRRMNCAVSLQALTDTPDGQGGSTRTWATTVTDIASIEALTGQEKLQEGAADQAVTHRILLSYQTGVDPTMRVLYGTRIFDIHTVKDYSEQHLLLELMAEEKFTR